MNLSQTMAILPENQQDKGRLAALTGGLLISFDSVFVRLSEVGGVETVFLFGLFSALSMGLLIQFKDRRGLVGTLKESGWPAVLSGLLILGSASMFVLSVKHTAVANTMIILSGRPVMTATIAWLLLRERTSSALWLAIVGVMLGIGVVVSGSLTTGNPLGDTFAVTGVICLGLNGTLWRRYKDISRLAVVGLGGLFLALAMAPMAHIASIPLRSWAIMACMGLFSAPLGRVLNAVSSRYIPASEMATISLINPILAPLWVFLLFGEQPPTTTLWGGLIVMASIGVYLWRSRIQTR